MSERVEAARLGQYVPAPGVIDLAWGHPDPSLLPVQQLRDATHRAMDLHGPDIRSSTAARRDPHR